MKTGEFPHDRPPHDTSSIALRPPLRWPNGARLAFAVVVSAEYYEMQPAAANFIPANVPGGFGRAPYPDFRAFSQRDYGNRVGVFRVIEALERFAMPATAAIDANVAARYPYMVEQFRKRNIEIAGHGHAVTNVITNHMAEAENAPTSLPRSTRCSALAAPDRSDGTARSTANRSARRRCSLSSASTTCSTGRTTSSRSYAHALWHARLARHGAGA